MWGCKKIMRVLLIHLSDLHIVKESDEVLKRVSKIKGAIISLNHNIEKCFLVATGDIAYSGSKAQYILAFDFITTLQEELLHEGIELEVEIVPGNHDCNFKSEYNNGARTMIITQLRQGEPIIDKSIISTCTRIQDDFFEFYNVVKDTDIRNVIIYNNTYNLQSKKIKFYCLNTAWMSTIHEHYGELMFPIEYIEHDECEDSVNIALLHHPYSWFDFNSRKMMKKSIEGFSDIILTGHEHDGDMHTAQNKDGTLLNYIEGGVMQDNENQANSTFNIIELDLNEMNYRYNEFEYENKMYLNAFQSEWKQLRESGNRGSLLKLNSEFEELLNDAGAGFEHKEKDKIYLEDIYIYPDVKPVSIKEHSSDNPEIIIKGERIYDFTVKEKRAFFIGESTTGKTSLAKQLFKTYLSDSYIPLILSGTQIISLASAQIENLIYEVFITQYSKQSLENYKQQSIQKKVLILDDFHKIKYNLAGKNNIVKFLEQYFDVIIIFSSDDMYMEIFSDHNEYNKTLVNYSYYQINQFGYLLRHKLISKWYSIGNEFTEQETELEKKIIKAEEKINVLLGKNLMPSYPLNILLILPLCDNIDPIDHHDQKGAYGYLYEVLITKNILRVKSKILIDTKYTYLSVLAYYKFEKDLSLFDDEALDEAHKIYENKHDKKVDFEVIIKELIDSNIIEKNGSSYNFKYKYLYYYFIAKYLSNNIEDKSVRDKIVDITGKLHNETNANVILFLCHLSKNSFIIENILNTAKDIFKEYKPCDLNEHVIFLNKLYDKIPQVVIDLGDPRENREKYLESKDKHQLNESSDNSVKEEIASDKSEEESLNNSEEAEKIKKLNRSLKTLQILGLVVKNFEGSLDGNIKYDLTKEAYLLGMRTLSLYMETIEKDLEQWIMGISELFNHEINNEQDAKKFICILCEFFTFGIIKKISQSIGLEELNETYKRINSDNELISFELIDVNIKMDNYRDFPEALIYKLDKEFKRNYFAKSLLHKCVANHFYLYSSNFATRQRICSNLGIKLNITQTLAASNKLLK